VPAEVGHRDRSEPGFALEACGVRGCARFGVTGVTPDGGRVSGVAGGRRDREPFSAVTWQPRAVGDGRWTPGEVILWCYEGDAVPVRVVRDDADGLVAWLAPGTPRLAVVPADGRGLRDRPPAERFTGPRRYDVTTWTGAGILRLERPGREHSLWLFRDAATGVRGWYANLEDPLRRSEVGVHTRDHVLDVWIDATGFTLWKDEDEMAALLELGLCTPDHAAAVRAEGERVIAEAERGDPPFDGSWLDWDPDPAWELPTLPAEKAALHGTSVPDGT